MTYDHERSRRIDRELAQYETGGILPFLAVLAAIVAGLVIYQVVTKDDTTQTANMPSTMEKVAPTPPAMPRAPAETTGSGAVR
jgi:hypothetical protein